MADSSIEQVADLLFRDLQYLKARSVERCVTEVAGYRGVAEADISSSVEQNLRMAIHAVKSGIVPESSQLALEARVAQVRFHQGLRIEDIMRGYRLSMAVIQDRFIDIAQELRLGDREVLAAHRVLWGVSDSYTAALVDSYREISVQQAVRDHERRQGYLRAVLAGTLAGAELVSRSADFGIDPRREFRALRARPRAGNSPDELLGALVSPLRTGDGVLTVLAGDVVGFVTARPAAGASAATVAVGPARPLADLALSDAVADRVFAAAWRRPGGGSFCLEDLTWRTAAADPDVTAVLRQRYLAPFAHDTEFGRIVLESVRLYLANDRRISAAAKALAVHENTLRYRLQKFEQLTGTRLDASDTLVELLWVFEGCQDTAGTPTDAPL
ncbi:putative transposase [Arthrobacter oryzae]|uniref:PucR family transcriptional regulator n=1 Tax=Arthrobacter TaxID=1663 RepID=UPI002780B033|nr:helix-turn-helix domain-containing protein [Arthrobacter oryzae]MDP9986075.1 putative transposase [Arthrobacter oryzae]